jgi:hypothetical protein
VGWNDEDDGPVERYTPSPERRAAALEAKQRALRVVYVITALTAVTGLVAAVLVGLTT